MFIKNVVDGLWNNWSNCDRTKNYLSWSKLFYTVTTGLTGDRIPKSPQALSPNQTPILPNLIISCKAKRLWGLTIDWIPFVMYHSFGLKAWKQKNCVKLTWDCWMWWNTPNGRVEFEEGWLIKSIITTDEMSFSQLTGTHPPPNQKKAAITELLNSNKYAHYVVFYILLAIITFKTFQTFQTFFTFIGHFYIWDRYLSYST